MMSGLTCFLTKHWLMLSLLGISCLVSLYWWMKQPSTPEALFQERCSSCHELQIGRLCEFPPELRPRIVKVMRQNHDASDVINDAEAAVIEQYLEVGFTCP